MGEWTPTPAAVRSSKSKGGDFTGRLNLSCWAVSHLQSAHPWQSSGWKEVSEQHRQEAVQVKDPVVSGGEEGCELWHTGHTPLAALRAKGLELQRPLMCGVLVTWQPLALWFNPK